MGKKGVYKPPMMERAGIWFLRKLHKQKPPSRIDIKTHVLDGEERKNIIRIENWAIINVVIAGALSSVASGLAAFLADPLSDGDSNDIITYWVIVIGSTILASAIEIFYIYYDIMAKAYALSSAAHMELFPEDTDEELIVAPIVRAALELPNKKEKDLNIDPKRESSKPVIFLASVFYKLKISVTNFLFKALVKRMLGRAISRAWLNFLSVPVCAFWNGMVCWLVIREVKFRVLGPSAVNELLNSIRHALGTMSEKGQLSLLRAIGSSIVRTADLHPNLEYMYRLFTAHIDEPENSIVDDSRLFLEDLKTLPQNEKKIVLQTLVYASIIDGRINFREKKLLHHAYSQCDMPFVYSEIESLLKRFRGGLLLDFEISE